MYHICKVGHMFFGQKNTWIWLQPILPELTESFPSEVGVLVLVTPESCECGDKKTCFYLARHTSNHKANYLIINTNNPWLEPSTLTRNHYHFNKTFPPKKRGTFEPSQTSLRWAADKLQEKSSMMLSKKQLQGADLGVLPGVPIGSMYSIYTYMTG